MLLVKVSWKEANPTANTNSFLSESLTGIALVPIHFLSEHATFYCYVLLLFIYWKKILKLLLIEKQIQSLKSTKQREIANFLSCLLVLPVYVILETLNAALHFIPEKKSLTKCFSCRARIQFNSKLKYTKWLTK